MAGVDPFPYTIRQLCWMAEAKCRDRWGHTASVVSMIANTARDPKRRRRPYTPNDFNPYAKKERRKGGLRITNQNIGILKTIFVKKKS